MFFLIDDFGWADASWHRPKGYKEVQTPHMQQLVDREEAKRRKEEQHEKEQEERRKELDRENDRKERKAMMEQMMKQIEKINLGPRKKSGHSEDVESGDASPPPGLSECSSLEDLPAPGDADSKADPSEGAGDDTG